LVELLVFGFIDSLIARYKREEKKKPNMFSVFIINF